MPLPSGPGLMVTTRKIAARDSGAVTACGTMPIDDSRVHSWERQYEQAGGACHVRRCTGPRRRADSRIQMDVLSKKHSDSKKALGITGQHLKL